MSNARELALLEKWADAPPPLSPTSPKATNFCCCPQRRRYTIKQPKKSTLHARNIFIDNDFTYIDDVPTSDIKTTNSSNSTSNSCQRRKNTTAAGAFGRRTGIAAGSDDEASQQAQLLSYKEHCSSDYDDIVEIAINNNNSHSDSNGSSTTAVKQHESERDRQRENEAWRHELKSACHNSSNNCSSGNNKDDNNSCDCAKQSAATPTTATTTKRTPNGQQQSVNSAHTATAATTTTTANQIAQQSKAIAIADNNCTAVTGNSNSNSVNDSVAAAAATTTAVTHQQRNNNEHEDISNSKCQSNRTDQQIQRLSNSEFNLNYRDNSNNCGTSSSSNNSSTATQASDSSCSCLLNSCCNYCQMREPLTNNTNSSNTSCNNNNNNSCSSNIKIDTAHKMTITTTTNVVNRKRSDCGLTATATAEAATSSPTSPTLERATTPSLTATATATAAPTKPTTTTTTVIKTVAVKRSPLNEATTANATTTTPTATTPTATTNASNVANHKRALENALLASKHNNTNHISSNNSSSNNLNNNNKCAGYSEPTRSVKERIAALVAGNEQAKNHDNSIKSKTQCNKTPNNMTNTAKSAIDSLHHNLLAAGSNKCATAAATSPTTAVTVAATTTANVDTTVLPAAAAPAATENSAADIPRQNSGLSDTQRGASLTSTAMETASPPTATTTTTLTTPTAASLVGNTGCATVPRRRNPSLAANERCYGCVNNGSNNNTKCGSNTAAMTVNEKFFAADKEMEECLPGSRDLAALDNLDLALNLSLTDEDGEDPYCALQEYLERVKHEINEVFELHKARQKMQQLQQEDPATSETHTTTTTVAPIAEVSTDELSRSMESDSGFDSASGGHFGCNCSCNNKSPLRLATTTTMENSCPSCDKRKYANSNIEEPRTPTTTKLKALPPPPLSPGDDADDTIAATSTAIHLHTRSTPADVAAAEAATEAATDDVNIWANKFLRDLDNLMAADKPASSSASSSPVSTTGPLLLSAAATAAVQCRHGGKSAAEREQQQQQLQQQQQQALVLRLEKHATIPLQSFNLDCRRRNSSSSSTSNNNSSATTNSNVAYMRTLSAPAPAPAPTPYPQQQQNDNKSVCCSVGGGGGNGKSNRNSLATCNAAALEQQQQHAHNLANIQSPNAAATNAPTDSTTTILKIEETAASGRRQALATAALATDEELLKAKQRRQLQNDMETIRSAILTQRQQLAAAAAANSNSSSDKNMLVASATATSIPKRERINPAMTTTATAAAAAAAAAAATKTTAAAAGNSLSPLANMLTPPPSSSSSSASSASSTSSSSSSAKMHAAAGGTSSSAAATATPTMAQTSAYLLNGNDTTKKGSTSTIWTSEESILRSVGAVDEDNNSTSSSACEEASGVLSSGKSGISLDSSGLDNDNNESGIGTATPPKDLFYWKSAHNDNESVSSLDALRKMKFQKSSSVASSDDPDLLEVLSLYDEPHGDEEVGEDVDESHDDNGHDQQHRPQQQQPQLQQKQKQKARQLSCHHRRRQNDNDDSNEALVIEAEHADVDADDSVLAVDDADEDDEGHDEFETVPYCDCEYTDGDASSASGSGGGGGGGGGSTSGHRVGGSALLKSTAAVVLRRKCSATPIMVPYGGGRAQKSRSHSLDTCSLPTSYQQQQLQLYPHQHHPHAQLSRKLQHLQNRTKERGQLSLALRQEPFQSLLAPAHFNELPSPSSASLHSGHESLGIQELTTKSNSAPLLLKQEKKRDDFAGQKLSLRYSRSQSDRYLAEIEAVEACKWLRAAGFPQYAQMYEDHQFPIDLTNVAKDHTNLENDQLQSLYRRLCILNRCANMRVDQSHKTQTPQKEDSDDENFALSENWTFQPHIRRWSRIGEMGLELPPSGKLNAEKTESSSKESSPDRFDDDTYDITGAGLALALPGAGDSTDTTLNDSADTSGVRLRRTGSERLKDGAKALLRRVESIKSRRRKRQNRDGLVISGPQALDLSHLAQRSSMRKPDAVYSTPPSPSAVSPMHAFPKGPFFGNELKVPSQSENFLSPHRASPKRTPTTPRSMRTSPLHFFSNPMPHLKEGKSDDSSSYYSDSQESSTGGKLSLRKTPSKTRRFLQRTGKVDDIGAHSDSECHQGRKLLIKDANCNTTEVKIKKLTRGGSLNLGKDPKKRDGFRSASFRSRSTTRKEPKTEETDIVKRTPVMRWHSFQMEERPQMIFRKCFAQKIDQQQQPQDEGIPFAAMSAGQLQIIRKLALVVLTGHMERYCPTHRSGWNWELPKFIKKIKMPDYKDKKVFGVPPLLVLHRTGQTLPTAVRAAFRWLQLNALDQIGLFRKSGVKSRIIKLKELIEYSESTVECMDVFDTQQAYDVADMLKQYFRDLPESLLTTKMSETFAAIFQHLPPDVRLDAVQSAVLLLPDENREILFALLEFLTLVAANSQYNQMTANNLAVCLAPSLFHSSISTAANSVSASPRRRGKGTGVPDVKELSEAKASHECLAFMIENYRQIYIASKEKISKCNFGYMEESKPVPLEALGEGMQFHNWRGYLYECTSATIKEGREKTRGWFTVASLNDSNVDIAYKKVGDGHPLRLWRCITEVEGPPREVLDYIVKQRASWDANLLQCQTVKKLDDRTEIFQFSLDGQITTDFCVLRSWQTDLPRGACVIVETSIDHAEVKPMFGAVRGVVLASRYLIEPCGSGRSRVMHLARVDIKGKTPEWYNKSYGHICSHYLSKIRLAFKNVTEGPESKV